MKEGKCVNCVNFGGERCNEIIDEETGDYYKPRNPWRKAPCEFYESLSVGYRKDKLK